MTVSHEPAHELGILWVGRNLCRDYAVDCFCGSTQSTVLDEDVRMRDTALLEFNAMNHVVSPACARKHPAELSEEERELLLEHPCHNDRDVSPILAGSQLRGDFRPVNVACDGDEEGGCTVVCSDRERVRDLI